MITINELIKELKIVKITHAKLEDVITCQRGKTLRSKCNEGSIPIVASGEKPLGYTDKSNRNQPCITISSSGNAGGIILYWDKPIWAADCLTVVSKNNQIVNLKYLYYFLLTLQPTLISLSTGGAQKHIYAKNFYNLDIYFPSLPYQQQIVKILDDFTELESKLESELESELEARKKQYTFWQNYFLNDKNWTTSNIFHIKLEDLFDYRNGYTPSTSNELFWKGGTVPWFRIDDIRNSGSILYDADKHITPISVKGNKYIEPDSIIIATTATIGVHALVKVKSLCNQQLTILTLKGKYKNKVNMKFIYYYCYLLDEYCIRNKKFSSFPSVDMNSFDNFVFNIPSLEYQNNIVEILDRFNNLTTNLQDEIPAEIKLRKEQYQYYLKQLLNFNNQTK